MKLVKTASGEQKLQITKDEWLALGEQTGWIKKAADFKNQVWVKFREATHNNSAMEDAVVAFLIGLREIPGMTNALIGDIVMNAEQLQQRAIDEAEQKYGPGEQPNVPQPGDLSNSPNVDMGQ